MACLLIRAESVCSSCCRLKILWYAYLYLRYKVWLILLEQTQKKVRMKLLYFMVRLLKICMRSTVRRTYTLQTATYLKFLRNSNIPDHPGFTNLLYLLSCFSPLAYYLCLLLFEIWLEIEILLFGFQILFLRLFFLLDWEHLFSILTNSLRNH
jgi:hypothetical protein